MEKELKQYRIVANVILDIYAESEDDAWEKASEEFGGLTGLYEYDIEDVWDD